MTLISIKVKDSLTEAEVKGEERWSERGLVQMERKGETQTVQTLQNKTTVGLCSEDGRFVAKTKHDIWLNS